MHTTYDNLAASILSKQSERLPLCFRFAFEATPATHSLTVWIARRLGTDALVVNECYIPLIEPQPWLRLGLDGPKPALDDSSTNYPIEVILHVRDIAKSLDRDMAIVGEKLVKAIKMYSLIKYRCRDGNLVKFRM